MHVDATTKYTVMVSELGTVLLQHQIDKLRIIEYRSRNLTVVEKKYHSSKLGFFALKWAVCNHFRDYLYYSAHIQV